jgi:hypothetical protein
VVHLLEGGLDVVDADLLGDEGVEVEAALERLVGVVRPAVPVPEGRAPRVPRT